MIRRIGFLLLSFVGIGTFMLGLVCCILVLSAFRSTGVHMLFLDVDLEFGSLYPREGSFGVLICIYSAFQYIHHCTTSSIVIRIRR
jgi:hypothetical protein